ncbi:MAG TPA: PIG-L family deacetylase [Phenylobacterium sp.]|nr:PIG-L family deacetylase [Phenylobacterium sp.]
MAVVHIFAHFDDEYCALPLIRQRAREGIDQWFLYVADYASAELARTRHAETRALLAHLGVDPRKALHVGAGTGAVDGAVYRHLETAYAALAEAVAGVPAIEGFVVTAWEGGHMDHDMCAMMTAELARARGAPVEQISLYNGKGLGGPFFHGGAPLAENGPVTTLPLGGGDWLAWMSEVRFFPSQAKTWLGLWPAMFYTYAQRGFGYQQLDPARIEARPHAGSLFYERMFKVPYPDVCAAADAFRQART